MLRCRDTVAEDRDGLARRQLPGQLDGERVHRHRPDDETPFPADGNLRPGEVAAEPVRVPDRDDPDPRRPLGDERPSVARAVTRRELLDEREVRLPAQRRHQPSRGRVVPEGRDPVQRDSAPRRIEPRSGIPECRRAVRDVPGQAGVRLGRRAKALDLEPREVRIALGRREVAHQPDDVASRRRQLREAPAPHSRIQLEMNRHSLGDAAVGRHELEPRRDRLGHLAVGRRAEDDDPRLGQCSPDLERLAHVRDAQRGRASVERRTRDVHRPVPVAVGLDDGPQLGTLERAQQCPGVRAHRRGIQRKPRAVHTT